MTNDDIFNKDMSPLFEAYGRACYAGQNLEHSFRLLLILNAYNSAIENDKENAFKKVEIETALLTLNQVFRKAQEKEYFSRERKNILIKANQLRNHVIHEYWDKNIAGIITPDGRFKIKCELEEYAKALRAADLIVVELIDNYLIEHGLTTDMLKERADQIYEGGFIEVPEIKH